MHNMIITQILIISCLLILVQAFVAESPMWPAITSFDVQGPKPSPKNGLWRQCGNLTLQNQAGMPQGSWSGRIKLTGGKLVKYVQDIEPTCNFLLDENTIGYKPLDQFVTYEYCVDYANKYNLDALVDVVPLVNPHHYFLKVEEKHGITKRSIHKRMYVKSYETGDCACVKIDDSAFVNTNIPPPPTLISINGMAPSDFVNANTAVLNFAGTARSGDTIHVYANETIVGKSVTDTDRNWNCTTTSVDDGAYIYSVTAISPSGYESTSAPQLPKSQVVTIVKPLAGSGQGCLLMNETFSTSQILNPNFIPLGSACLTAATSSTQKPINGSSLSYCTSGTAPAGYLQLTSNVNYQAGAVLFNQPIRSGDGFEVTMTQYQYGGSGADGIALFLVDGDAQLNATGGWGGSLGYAQYTGNKPGVLNSYIGVGLDAYGNFGNDQESRGTGCTVKSPISGTQSQTLVLRGPGNGLTGYCYMNSTRLTTMSPPRSFRGATLSAGQRNVRIAVTPTPNPRIIVDVDFLDGKGFITLINSAAPSYGPDTFKIGFTSATGGANDYHLLRDLVIKSKKYC